jgi:hypothetical protein
LLLFALPNKTALSHQIAYTLTTVTTDFIQRDYGPKAFLLVTRANKTFPLFNVSLGELKTITTQQNSNTSFASLNKTHSYDDESALTKTMSKQ